MMFHHLVTVFLFGGSIYLNFIGIGSVVAYIHDVSDFVCGVLKIFAETKYDNATRISYVVLMLLWIYTRLIFFPLAVYFHDYSSLQGDALTFHYIL